jgi:Protein of unknown function (DUF1036)
MVSARRRCVWGAAAALSIASLMLLAPRPAQARDMRPNLDRYCQKHYGARGIFRDHWEARWGAREQRWVCYKEGTMGFGVPIGPTIKPLNLSAACREQFHTGDVHFAEAANHRKPDVVLCGAAPAPNLTPPPVGMGPAPPPGDGQQQTILRMCNVSNHATVNAAYAYWDSETRGRQPGWTSVGWYTLPKGQCAALPIIGNSTNETYLGYVYIFGVDGGEEWRAQDGAFCIDDTSGFVFPDSDKMPCDRPPLRRVGMARFHIEPGENDWQFR